MFKELTGKVYDIQGFSVQDGPGIRTTVFLKGCPLRCPWCHSPESQEFHSQLSWISMRCIGIEKCGKCLETCPRDAIAPGDVTKDMITKEDIQHIRIDRSICDDCGDCAAVCYPDALFICGTDYNVNDLADKLRRALENPEEALKIGVNGRETAIRNFDYRAQAELLKDFYESF